MDDSSIFGVSQTPKKRKREGDDHTSPLNRLSNAPAEPSLTENTTVDDDGFEEVADDGQQTDGFEGEVQKSNG